MEIKVSNKLIIKSPTEQITEWCRKNLIVNNPDYKKKARMGKWTGDTPKAIRLYEECNSELYLPYGCFLSIWQLHPVKEDYTLDFAPMRRLDYRSDIKLYDYQERAVEAAMKYKNGILVMPCGSGKTISGLSLISKIGGKALWLTHTQDLLNQSKRRAEDMFSNIGLGTITEGKVNIGSHITFATVQTMSRLDLDQYKNEFDIIIVDECQHLSKGATSIKQFEKVVSNLATRYKIGLTATPKRSDGLEIGMFALLGGIIYEVKREDIKTCPVKVLPLATNWTTTEDVLAKDGSLNYHKIVDLMTHDKDRFNLILSQIQLLSGPTIVLANRIEYLKALCDKYNKKAICLSGMAKTKKAKEERKNALEALNNGEIDCIFSTYQLSKEGLDVPNLRYVVFATPEKDPATVEQSAGRVGRQAEEKTHGTVIDFVDAFSLYESWWVKRAKIFQRLGYDFVTNF